jgi:hypothetical protein
MGSGRVYLPLTPDALRRARDEGRFGPAPLRGHAVTAALVAALDASGEGATDEESEYAALTAAAVDALSLLGPEDRPLRVVVAVDVAEWETGQGGDDEPVSLVTVSHEVPIRRLASVQADSPDASTDVAAARDAVAAGGDDAEAMVETCLDRELGWYAAQEIDLLLDGWSTEPS